MFAKELTQERRFKLQAGEEMIIHLKDNATQERWNPTPRRVTTTWKEEGSVEGCWRRSFRPSNAS